MPSAYAQASDFCVPAPLTAPQPDCLPPTFCVGQNVLRACAQEGSERSQSLLQTLGCFGRVGRLGSRKFALISICLVEIENRLLGARDQPMNIISRREVRGSTP